MEKTKTYNAHSSTHPLKCIFLMGCLLVGVVVFAHASDCTDQQAPQIKSNCSEQVFCLKNYDCSPQIIQLKVDATDDQTPTDQLDISYRLDLDDNGRINDTGHNKTLEGDFPPGKHRVYWTIRDLCGNVSQCDQYFTVKDCSKPKANCINGTSLDLPADQKIAIEASDVSVFSHDNCALSNMGLQRNSINPSLPKVESLQFGCRDLGMQKVFLIVEDQSGHTSQCSTFVFIADPKEHCEREGQRNLEAAQAGATQPAIKKATSHTSNLLSTPFHQQTDPSTAGYLQNTPNPFSANTTIHFYIPKPSKTTITIYNVSGHLIKRHTASYVEGVQQLSLPSELFPGPGFYICELSHPSGTLTHRMLRMDGKK